MKSIVITKASIQNEAEQELDRKLSKVEYEEVYYEVVTHLWEFIRDSIQNVVQFNKMLERNNEAEKSFPHYVVYHRNPNAYQSEFKRGLAFTNEVDANIHLSWFCFGI